MSVGTRILVVEDDSSIALGLRMALERHGYEVALSDDGVQGLERASSEPWDLIILDVMLPRLNGYEFLGAMRTQQMTTPVLMLSARTSEVDKVMGLDLGAEDYITKPFGVPELLARVRAALRRRKPRPTMWRFGGVVVDATTREVTKDGERVQLTATEFDVLAVLVRADGGILTRAQIFEAVWGASHHGTHRTVDNFIAQLRAKLEDDPRAPDHLLTARGVGYRLSF